MKIQRLFPRYDKYQTLFMHSTDLQDALCSFYAALVGFCTQMVIVIRRPGPLHFARTLLLPFHTQFGELESKLQIAAKDVEKWIQYAADEAASQERGTIERWRNTFQLLSRKDQEWKLAQDQRTRSMIAPTIHTLQVRKVPWDSDPYPFGALMWITACRVLTFNALIFKLDVNRSSADRFITKIVRLRLLQLSETDAQETIPESRRTVAQ